VPMPTTGTVSPLVAPSARSSIVAEAVSPSTSP
jgi:hypothetical protein